MQTVLFYTVTLGFVLGVFLGSFFTLPLSSILLLLLIGSGLLILGWRTVIYTALAKKSLVASGSVVVIIGVLLCMICVGLFRMDNARESLAHKSTSVTTGPVTLTGQVIREPDVREGMSMLTVATADTRVLLRVDRYSDIRYGDTIEVSGNLERPDTFETDLGREFDYPGYLEARGITHTMSFVTPVVIARDESSLLARLYRVKQYFLLRLALVLPDPAYGLGAGLLLGVQSALGEALLADFRAAGIVHMVVLSGYNIMLVAAFILTVTAFFLPFRGRLVLAIGAIIIFAVLVGYSPSVLRATSMAVLFLLTMLLARPYQLLRMLVLAGTLMVAYNPYMLRYDIGFQLSFMATLGLVLVAPQFEQLVTRVTTWFSLRTFLVATVATQIAVLPLILYHIGEWSLVAVPVNLLTLPMVPVAMLLTFLTGLVALVSTTLALPLALLATLSLAYIIHIASYAASLSFATVIVPAFSPYFIPVCYGVLILIWCGVTYVKGSVTTVVRNEERAAMAGWEIIEESAYQASLPTTPHLKQVEATASTRGETPIFFRE